MSDEKQTEVLIVAQAFQTFVNSVVTIKDNALLKPATLEKLDDIANIVLDKFAEAAVNINFGDEQPPVEPLP